MQKMAQQVPCRRNPVAFTNVCSKLPAEHQFLPCYPMLVGCGPWREVRAHANPPSAAQAPEGAIHGRAGQEVGALLLRVMTAVPQHLHLVG